jgi:hypothetical protein
VGRGRVAWRPTVESTGALVLDVLAIMRPYARALRGRTLARDVALPPFRLRWSRHGEPWCEVELTLTVAAGARRAWLRLRYEIAHHSAATGPQDYSVALATTTPHFGGRQWWFLCPATGRRCRKLFLPNGGRRFLSRQAYGLFYRSQAAGRMERMRTRIGKLCRRLGGAWSVSSCDLPPKPKWMRWATYRRMEAQAWAAEEIIDAEFAAAVARLRQRLRGAASLD